MVMKAFGVCQKCFGHANTTMCPYVCVSFYKRDIVHTGSHLARSQGLIDWFPEKLKYATALYTVLLKILYCLYNYNLIWHVPRYQSRYYKYENCCLYFLFQNILLGTYCTYLTIILCFDHLNMGLLCLWNIIVLD